MIEYEIEILEYLNEAYEDKGLFPSGTHGWIRIYRIAKDLDISKNILIISLEKLQRKLCIETEPSNSDIATRKPPIRITMGGIERLQVLSEIFIDAWHFEAKNRENAALARNWESSGVHPHIRLEIKDEDDEKMKTIAHGRTSFLHNKWTYLNKKTVRDYSFYQYYRKQRDLDELEKGYFWLRGSGFWRITEISIRRNKVIVWIRNT